MKNSNNDGFDQHYNAQVAVDQASFLIVASPCPTIPTIKPRPTHLGRYPWPWADPRRRHGQWVL